MTTIYLDGFIIATVREHLRALASRAESQATSAQSNTPIDCGLPGNKIQQAVQFIDDADKDLEYVEDLAYLLDSSGAANFDAPSGSLADLKEAFINELGDQVENFDDMDNPGDREEMELLAEIMGRHAQDVDVSSALVERLGPEGMVDTFYSMQAWITESGQPNYQGGTVVDTMAEIERIKALQDTLATSLSAMLGTASRQSDFPEDYGREMVDSDARGWGIATIFDYGDESANYPGFGTDLLVSAGEAMLEREQGQGSDGWDPMDSLGTSSPLEFGSDQDDDMAMNDPTLQWLQVLDDNPDASQQIMLDEDRMVYLLSERESSYESTQGAAAGDALRAATIDQATGYDPRYDEAGGIEDQRARNASIISANVLDKLGVGAEPHEGVDEEIGGIIATYIADVDRTAQSRSDEPGDIYSNGENLPSWLRDGEGGTRGMPPYGIKMNFDDLRDILEDVGDNDTAKSVVGEATTAYNQARLNHYADVTATDGHLAGEVGGDDPLIGAVNSSAQLNGFMTDALVTGDIENQEERAAARRSVAEFFTLPLDAIPTGKTGPVGGFIIGGVKDQIIDGYVGDGVQDAITSGESAFNETAVATRIQALHTALSYEGEGADGQPVTIPVGSIRDDWPRDDNGGYLAPGQLDDSQILRILNDTENGEGYSGAIGREVDSAVSDLVKNYGDK